MPSIDGCGRPSRPSADVVGPSPSTAGRADKARSTTTGGSVANTVTVVASRTTQPSRDTLESRRLREPSRFNIFGGKTPTPIIGKDTRSHSTKKRKRSNSENSRKPWCIGLLPLGRPAARGPEKPPDTALATPSTSRILKHPNRAPKPKCCYRTQGQPSTSVDWVLQKKTGRAGNLPTRPVDVYPKLALVRVA